jgi:ATP-dependent DNA ligase
MDSGKDSGQKPRRSLHERVFHASVIPKCCSKGSGVRLVENPPKIPEKIQWVQPRLLCEVAYGEWTEDEHLRQHFLG